MIGMDSFGLWKNMKYVYFIMIIYPALLNPKKSAGLSRNIVFGPELCRNLVFVIETPGFTRYLICSMF